MMQLKKIISSYWILMAIPSVVFSADRIYDRHPEQNQEVKQRKVDVTPYEVQISEYEQSLNRLKIERDMASSDVTRFNDLSMRVDALESRIAKAKRDVKKLKQAFTVSDSEEAQRNVELQLANIQALIYRMPAE